MDLESGGTRVYTPPPSYDEVVRGDVGPPPIYTETDEVRRTEQQIPGCVNERRSRVSSNAWTEQNRVVVSQPRSQVGRPNPDIIIEQPSQTTRERNKGYSCNCFCLACKWKPCTSNGECFCYNCILFALYAIVCGPSVGCCLCWQKICPETFAECPTRDTSMMESYTFRNESFSSHCYWNVCGPLCCLSCSEHSDVCPLATPCEKRFGMKCIRKMTCYCRGSERSQCSVNIFDENACGFIWDYRELGFKSY